MRLVAYAYDGDNQLVSAASFDFTYDDTGRRLSTVDPDGTTTYAVMPEFEVVVFADGSRQHSIFVRGLGGVVATVTTVDAGSPPAGGGFPAPGTFYRYADPIDSTTVQTDEEASVVTRLSYLPYGTPFAVSGTVPAVQKFSGRGLNADLGLYYFGARYYDPFLGRFITADDRPGGSPDQRDIWNLYAYCGNDPVNNVDPSGHKFWEVFGSAIASVAFIALGVAALVIGGPPLMVLGSTLIGAGTGGLISTIQQSLDSKRTAFDWKEWGIQTLIWGAAGLVAGAVGVAGGAAADTLAAGGRAAFGAGGAGRVTVNIAASVIGNASGNALAQFEENVDSNTKLSSGVGEAALWGGVLGFVSGAATEALAAKLSRLARPAAEAGVELETVGRGAAVLRRVVDSTIKNNHLLGLPGIAITLIEGFAPVPFEFG